MEFKGVSMVAGDYNSTKLVFEFDKEYTETKVCEIAKRTNGRSGGNEALFVSQITNNEIVLVNQIDVKDENGYIKYKDNSDNIYWYDTENETLYDSEYQESSVSLATLTKVQQDVPVLNEAGKYILEVSLYGNNSKLTSMYTGFTVKPEMIQVDYTEVEAYLPIFDQLINNATTLINNLSGAISAEETRQSNEQTRISNETTRQSNETTRQSNETSRSTAETSRVSAEATRQTNETARQTAETTRQTAETARATAETSRESAETSRTNAETSRISAETSRASAESTRTSNENTRTSNETTRNSNEITRQTNETTRQAQEGAREESETARNTAETNRASAETSRGNAETTRAENETTRVSNENTRIANENIRIANETSRQGKYDKIETFLQPATATGTSIHTEDSADWYGKLNFEGFSRQETRSGKNKLNVENPLSVTEQTAYIPCVLPVGTYTISCSQAETEGTKSYYLIQVQYEDNTTGYFQMSKSTLKATITINKAVKNVKIYSQDGYQSSVGITTIFSDLMIEEGSEATDYEEYGVSPSIDYPSDIRNLESINKFKPIPSQTKNGVTLTYNKDGSYTLNGTATASANFELVAQTLEAGDYSLQCEYKGTLPNNASPRAQVYSNNVSFALNVPNNANNSSVSNLSLSSNVTDVAFRMRIENGFNYENVKLYPMLLKGTYTTAKLYAPYDNLRFKVTGKNFFTGWTKGKGLSSSNGSVTSNENGAISDFLPVDFIKNPNYFISGLTNRLSSFIAAYNANKEFLGRNAVYNRSSSQLDASVFSGGTPQGTGKIAYVRAYQYKASGDTGEIDNIDNLETQLEIGSTATDYEPYKEHNIDFPLGNEKMYQGSKPIDSGKQHIRTEIPLYNRSWAAYNVTDSSGNTYGFSTALSKTPKQSQVRTDFALCNILKQKARSGVASNDAEGFYLGKDNRLYIKIPQTFLPNGTVEELQQLLTEKNATLEYELDEPETVPYTQAQQEAHDELQNMETYQYVNNIELIANEETNMTLDYKKDIQMQIAERDTEIENIKSRLALLE
jgi:hypothetical protein